MDRKNAESLRDRVNTMLKEVGQLPADERPKGVNWADLTVRDICGEISYLHDNDTFWVFVDIEEASPESSHFFTKRLDEPNITIRCEW